MLKSFYYTGSFEDERYMSIFRTAVSALNRFILGRKTAAMQPETTLMHEAHEWASRPRHSGSMRITFRGRFEAC